MPDLPAAGRCAVSIAYADGKHIVCNEAAGDIAFGIRACERPSKAEMPMRKHRAHGVVLASVPARRGLGMCRGGIDVSPYRRRAWSRRRAILTRGIIVRPHNRK